MVLKKKKAASPTTPSEAQLKCLTAIDEWKKDIAADNLRSLLKDAILNDDIPLPDTATDWSSVARDKVLKELNSLYEEYSFATAKDASLTDDLRHELPDATEDSLVYGEIDLEGFCELLSTLPSTGTFYDLGSGSGRAVFAARFQGDFDRCIGIELLPNLHQLAVSVKSLYKFQYRHKLKRHPIEFICSDLLEHDWSDGTVVYVPSLLFDEAMMERIAKKALLLKPGSHLISLKKFGDGLTEFHEAFDLIQQKPVPMSWGESNVYVYRRALDDA